MSSVWPASRSSSDSPTQAITPSPCSSAAIVRRATVFVGLAEELAALRVADDGALHAELVEHGSRRSRR